MASFRFDRKGIPAGVTPTFLIREVSETIGNRFTSYNEINEVVTFTEIQDGNLHNYVITISAPGCRSATRIYPFQCTDTGGCDQVKGGEILINSKIAVNQSTPLSVTNLIGTTPYVYSWAASGANGEVGIISSTTTPSTSITFPTLGSYVITLTVENCGTTPLILTKTVEVVNEVCDKTSALCYFYGLNGTVPFSTYTSLLQRACSNSLTYQKGSFSNGLSNASIAYANADGGSCTKLLPGYYPIKTSSNGCLTGAIEGELTNTIIEVDITGKIIGVHSFNCLPEATIANILQPYCEGNALTDAIVTLSNINNADRYILCEGSSFDCLMNIPTGTINGSTTTIAVPPANPGETKSYIIRVFNQSNPTIFKDLLITIASPIGCGIKTPQPILYNATLNSNNIVTVRATLACIGTVNLYRFSPSMQQYILEKTELATSTNYVTTYTTATPADILLGATLAISLSCPAYGVVSDLSDPTLIATES